MNDEPTAHDVHPEGRDASVPEADGRAPSRSTHGREPHEEPRRRADEGRLITRWSYTWRAVTLRMADAVAQRIATPQPGRRSGEGHRRGRWVVGGAAAAAAYARSRGWL